VNQPLRLAVSEVPVGRAFAHPARTVNDVVSIRHMSWALRRILDSRSTLSFRARPLMLEVGDEAHPHRVVICDDDALETEPTPCFVGFFAIKRPWVDHALLTQVDDQLITEFPQHPGVLSYSSIALTDGNWGNLIVLRASSDGDRWRDGARHAWAARHLAPAHYVSVRLHNGLFFGGLRSGLEPVLLRTRYWDYRTSPPWRAERVLGGAT
jgi:hypothetical protein